MAPGTARVRAAGFNGDKGTRLGYGVPALPKAGAKAGATFGPPTCGAGAKFQAKKSLRVDCNFSRGGRPSNKLGMWRGLAHLCQGRVTGTPRGVRDSRMRLGEEREWFRFPSDCRLVFPLWGERSVV